MRIIAKGRTALTALFYDGTVARKCSDLTKYDADGRFRTSIRPKHGTFYDGTAALNSFRMGALDFIMAHQAAMFRKPAKRPLDNPTSVIYHERREPVR
jgi:hypothetical protein